MPRCPAKPWGPGGPSGPYGEAERGDQTLGGGSTAPSEHTEGGAPQKTYRRAILARFAFLAGGAGRALETGVTGTARGTGITTSALGTIFASRAGGTGGAWVTLRGGKTGLEQTATAFPPPSPTSERRQRSGSAPVLEDPQKSPFLWGEELPGTARGLLSSETLHCLAPNTEQAASPEPPALGVSDPDSPRAIPAAPEPSQLPPSHPGCP